MDDTIFGAWGNGKRRGNLVSYPESEDAPPHGHCSWCGETLAGRATMATNGNYAAVPVCEPCVPEQRRWLGSSYEPHPDPSRKIPCPGCGLVLSVPTAWQWRHINACSKTCAQRARRKAKRFKSVTCTVCRTRFETTRKDAHLCSGKCRQWAYRRRHAFATPPTPPALEDRA